MYTCPESKMGPSIDPLNFSPVRIENRVFHHVSPSHRLGYELHPKILDAIIPRCSMYETFTYIRVIFRVNVDIPYMDHLGSLFLP